MFKCQWFWFMITHNGCLLLKMLLVLGEILSKINVSLKLRNLPKRISLGEES